MEIQDIDEYQNTMQRTEEDDEYFNSSLSVTESSLTKSTNKSAESALINCKKDYLDDECEECKNHGEENNLFCLEHKDRSYQLKKRNNLLKQ